MASSSPSRLWNYDVFLSFRGKDTRRKFTSHLYTALRYSNIVTFKDDREIEAGDTISDEICQAIQDSRFAVVVISENYATSKWCLEELRMIMDLHTEDMIRVVPIFYGVDPSDVRHQTGSFDTAFQEYKAPELTEKVLRWRYALGQVAKLAGIHTDEILDEATMIKDIVEDISSRLSYMHPIDFGNVVGGEDHMERITSLLDMESESGDESCMIGIWGMGGIGKTTIAKCLYDRYSRQFPAHCFIENVKDICREHGLLYLQELMLSIILGKEKVVKLWSVEHGSQQIELRLSHRKVFLVLDNVDDVKQLLFLAEKPSWFGSGSRIIITTRDKGLLKTRGVNRVHEVKCLEEDDALRLFNHFAFQGGTPHSHSYKELSVRASRLAYGLPSALQSFGLHFAEKTTLEEWNEELHIFETSLPQSITKILKTSYESLDTRDKTLFLNIACLFNGDHVRRVRSLLDEGESRIKGLAAKSLIDISTDGCITMHALVEQTARELEIEEAISMPRKSRIMWDPEEICYVLKNNRTNDQLIECLSLHTCEMPKSMFVMGSVFDSMHGLKYLKLYKHSQDTDSRLKLITSNVSSTSGNLRLLHWDAYSLRALPFVFPTYYLVELILRYSNLETLWDKKPDLRKLRKLDLSGSKSLRKVSDLSSAIQLEEVNMEGCTSLEQIPASIGRLPSLRKLNLSKCVGLKSNVVVMKESTDFQRCSNMQSRPVVLEFPAAMETLIHLTDVSVEGEISILLSSLKGQAGHLSFSTEKHIPDESMMFASKLYGFRTLNIMRSNYSKCGSSFTCYRFSDFPILTELNLVNLNILVIPDDIGQLVSLAKLDLSGNDYKSLPTAMRNLSKLKYVRLCNCRELKALPRLPQVETLILSDCVNLKSSMEISVEEEPSRYSLLELSLDNCKSVESLSAQLVHFTNLRGLDLSGQEFESVPTGVKDLLSLLTLSLNNCKNLKSLTNIPLSLKCLNAHGCKSLETVSVSKNHSLENVDLGHCLRLKLDTHLISQLQIHTSNEVSSQCGCLYQPTKSFLEIHPVQICAAIVPLGFAAIVMVLCLDLLPFH
ncbi:PREDICTED: disease resistance protein RML1A-like [Camelina sativa]|uniref:Disease resistance protein RML1A-like n=1 Tax=Camelina sativa TaxID=90675 RepID=A0ABM0TLM1_CAMSA|nr:PREDICTED: disease resistance protein RML1A-like [Camelina sativa]